MIITSNKASTKMEKNREKLSIEEYSNGIILPRLEVSAGPRWGLGGVCDQNNQFVDTSFYDGGWATMVEHMLGTRNNT